LMIGFDHFGNICVNACAFEPCHGVIVILFSGPDESPDSPW
jgi:hypothetical protein